MNLLIKHRPYFCRVASVKESEMAKNMIAQIEEMECETTVSWLKEFVITSLKLLAEG